MYIPGTLLELGYQEDFVAPPGRFLVVGMDTMTYDFLPGDPEGFETLEVAQGVAEGMTGGEIGSFGSGQTMVKAYVFNDHGEKVGEAGSF